MRTIKFRIWVESIKKMGTPFTIQEALEMGAEHDMETEELFIEQFTGLLDRNGKEIYEGDVCERIWADDDKLRFEVVFRDLRFGEWWRGMSENSIADGSIMSRGRVEVIGNIHENPELIGEPK